MHLRGTRLFRRLRLRWRCTRSCCGCLRLHWGCTRSCCGCLRLLWRCTRSCCGVLALALALHALVLRCLRLRWRCTRSCCGACVCAAFASAARAWAGARSGMFSPAPLSAASTFTGELDIAAVTLVDASADIAE